MGNSGSKKKKGGKGSGGDDGCIGNRRVRTIVLSIIIMAFFIFATPFAQENEETYRQFVDPDTLITSIGGALCGTYCEDQANAWAFVLSGCIVCIVGCIAAILLFIIPNCDDKLGRVAGFILIIGGILYMIGWIWLIAVERDIVVENGAVDWEDFPEETRNNLNAKWAAKFGEALLAGGSAILLGLDAMLQIYENEAYRLASNLGIIMTVAGLCCGAYYAQICPEPEEQDSLFGWASAAVCVQPDGVEAIATGYMILFVTTLVYIVLYICTCCTCNCKDTCLIRVLLAAALVIGGILTAIGYYVYSGFDEDTDTDDYYGKCVVYFVGYTILIGGLCIVWALDIALDDVKNSRK